VKLTLSGPSGVTSIKQGATQTVPITLERNPKYSGNVKLKLDSPKGISSSLTSSTIKAADSGEVGLKITADKTAPLGEHIIRISGTPDGGKVSAAEVKVKVID
jgi:uncharacterized membrane protein